MCFEFQKFFNKLICFCFLVTVSTAAIAEQGLFWKAESPAGKMIYLFGTIHTDDDRVTNFSPPVIEALQSVDAFMMETLPPDDSSALMMQTSSLEDMLTKQELEQLYALAEFHVLHRHVAVRMKPWLLAGMFDSPKPLTPFAQDNLLMAKAGDLAKEIIGLETTAEHFGVMDEFTLDDQLIMLRAVLKRTPEAKQQDYERLMQAYLAGDSDKLAALNNIITGSSLPRSLWERMRSKLLDERNAMMAERMIKAASTKNIFVVVGASHLAGEGGLIARLKLAGYKLSHVK